MNYYKLLDKEMELKKVFINILHPLSISQNVGTYLNNQDIDKNIKGFHLQVVNKVNKSFTCNCFFESYLKLNYSFSTKLTDKKTSFTVEFNYHKIKFEIDEFETKNIYIFLDKVDEDFELEETLYFTKFQTDDYGKNFEIDKLELDNIDQQEEFEKIFGFEKKFHFDQYRYYVLLYLVNEGDKNLMSKILINSRNEREYINDLDNFYQFVYKNLIEEDIGEKFIEYKNVILQKLKIYVKDLSLLIDKKNSNIITERSNIYEDKEFKIKKRLNFSKNDVFDDGEIEYKEIKDIKIGENIYNDYKEKFELIKIVNLKNVNGVNFRNIIYQRKGYYFEPYFSIILIGDGDIEITLENLLKDKIDNYFEILIFDEKRVSDSLFKNYDKLFRLKIISPYQKIGKILNISNIQKMIVMSNFVKNTSEKIFVSYINSIFPKNYFNQGLNQNNKNKLYCVSKCDLYNKQNGLIINYEINKNYEFLSECLFPMFHLNMFSNMNFTNIIFGKINTLKDFRKLLLKNGTIIGINYLKTHNGLGIFEI